MTSKRKSIAIIGAGPAGCMCAYFAQKNCDVTLFDASSPLLTLLYTGGGRCNLAYEEYDFKELAKFYPRGEKFLYSVFSQFATGDTLDFFENIGVKTYIQEDLRIFPTSDSAKEVRANFLDELKCCGFKKERVLKVLTSPLVGEVCFQDEQKPANIRKQGEGNRKKLTIITDQNEYQFDSVVIAVGGHAGKIGFELAQNLGHKIIEPKPALTGLITKENLKPIQGVSLKNISARVIARNEVTKQSKNTPHPNPLPQGARERIIQGDLLFTHEGISGPLAYKISSICAREDFSKNNPLKIKFDFICHADEILKRVQDDVGSDSFNSESFQNMLNTNSKKDIKNLLSDLVPKSLANYLLEVNKINPNLKCHEINAKIRDLILESLQEFEINVISTAKDGEVVTSGGVSLDEINPKTMGSKLVQGLYFCGEIIDVDGFCGGFNLQN